MDEAPRSSELLEAEVEIAARESSTRLRRRSFGIGGWIAAGWMVLLVVCSMLAPVLPIADPDVSNASIARQAPSSAALLGGDANGRDVLARVVYGARASLLIGFGAIALGLVVGGALGLLGGYRGHRTDATVAGAFDVMLSVPALILALAFNVFLGPDVRNMIVALGIVAIPQLGRITREHADVVATGIRASPLAPRARVTDGSSCARSCPTCCPRCSPSHCSA